MRPGVAVCCGVGWEQYQGADREHCADACGDEAGGAEAVEERVGGCGVDGVRECWVAVMAGLVGELERAADGVVGGARVLRSQRRGKLVAQSVVVERDVDAADHGDAEGASEQAGGVVDGGADAGLGLRHDPHDRFGRGCAVSPTPRRRAASGRRSRGSWFRCAVETQAKKPASRPGRRSRPAWCRSDSELGAEHRHDPDGDRDGQQADAGGERRVALEELEVLGDQEAEPDSPKKAMVTEPLAAVKRRLRNRLTSSIGSACGALPEDEDREQRPRRVRSRRGCGRCSSRGWGPR